MIETLPFDAQKILDQYRFVDKGKDLFPKDAKQLTKEQLKQLKLCYYKVCLLKSNKETVKNLESILTTLKG